MDTLLTSKLVDYKLNKHFHSQVGACTSALKTKPTLLYRHNRKKNVECLKIRKINLEECNLIPFFVNKKNRKR